MGLRKLKLDEDSHNKISQVLLIITWILFFRFDNLIMSEGDWMRLNLSRKRKIPVDDNRSLIIQQRVLLENKGTFRPKFGLRTVWRTPSGLRTVRRRIRTFFCFESCRNSVTNLTTNWSLESMFDLFNVFEFQVRRWDDFEMTFSINDNFSHSNSLFNCCRE